MKPKPCAVLPPMAVRHRIGMSARALNCVLTMLLLNACAGLPPGTQNHVEEVSLEAKAHVAERSPDDFEHALRDISAFQERLRQMSREELADEVGHLDAPPGSAARLRLALALMQTRNSTNSIRALGIFEALALQDASEPAAEPWRLLAQLLASALKEQRRLEEHSERQAQQLRDSQRRQEQLSQQLEALKAIERSLTQRPATLPPLVAPSVPPAKVP